MRVCCTLLVTLASSAFGVTFDGFLTARGVNASGPPSWREAGFGRLGAGGDRTEAIGVAQLGVTWTPVAWLEAHASGIARSNDNAGLVEAWIEASATFANDTLALRAGQFFLPTSRENRGDLWTSPYTISFSALNTWIGEEVRPVGVDVSWRHTTNAGHVVTAAATAFQRNDTMGTLLGWRGWSIGNRLSMYDEVLPLPPLASLDRVFVDQRDDGTKPFGRDLDGRTGYAARVRYALPERAMIQLAHVDNRGDRDLHRGEYAWATRFDVLGAEAGHPDRVIVALELMQGKTGMGFAPGGRVDADFFAGYLLVSAKRGRHRLSGRFDRFQTDERDFSIGESNDEVGRSWTFAYLVDVTPRVRAAAEFTQVTGDRIAAPDPNTDARSVTLEVRYAF